jgi:hypothetical protein
MIVFTHYGFETVIKNIVGVEPNYLWYVRLFSNDHHPTVDDKIDSYIESDFQGYDRQMLLNWKYENKSKQIVASNLIWNIFNDVGEECKVYGYNVVDYSGNLIYSERFAGAPFLLSEAGSINLTPCLRLT